MIKNEQESILKVSEQRLVVFPSGHLRISSSRGTAACIFIRGGSKREEGEVS